MATTLPLRNFVLTPGQGVHENLDVEVAPYVQGGFGYTSPDDVAPMRVDISAMSEGWALRIRGDVTLTGPCSRCLGDAAIGFELDAHEVHDPKSKDEELISPFVSKDEDLDVTHWVQSFIAGEFPHRVLCKAECRGLCPNCGTDWNEGTCDCSQPVGDSRWEVLKSLQLETDEN